MASSGWQGNQEFPYPNSDLKCNLRIDSITHSGTSLRVTGAVGAVCTNNSSGWYAYYTYPVYVQPVEHNQLTLLAANERVYGDGSGGLSTAKTVSFDTTIPNVPSTATSYSFSVYITMNNGQSTGMLYWTITFDASGTAPTGLSVSHVGNTWGSVTGTVSISSYGTPASATGRYIEFGVCESTATQYSMATRKYLHAPESTSATLTVDQLHGSGSFTFKGCKPYKIGGWASNTQLSAEVLNNTIYYLPPAPIDTITATQTPGTSASPGYANVVCYITGSDNTKNEDVNVTTSYRYKIGSGSYSVWSTLGSDKPWVTRTVPTIPAPYGSTLTIQAKQTYQSQDSEEKQVEIAVIPAPFYGSVSGTARRLDPTYGSVGGQSVKLLKLYGSVNGQSVLIHETNT